MAIRSPSLLNAYQHPEVVALRLYCFPFAGGTAAAYRPWMRYFPADWQLVSVQVRHRPSAPETIGSDVSEVAGTLAEIIASDAGDVPYVLLGHSMGSLLAFEAAHALRRLRAPAPRLLAVSARRAPTVLEPRTQYHTLSDDGLLKAVQELGGIPAELADYPELVEAVLPALRADLALAENYRHQPRVPLDLPIAIFSGEGDVLAPPAAMEAWRETTTGPGLRRAYPGGHFYLWEHGADVLASIGRMAAKG